jgi:hypothetical protein
MSGRSGRAISYTKAGIMFGKQFFEVEFPRSVADIKATVRTAIHTVDGEYKLRRVLQTSESYAWLEVYPAEGWSDEARKERTDARGDVIHDRVAVLYQTITSVFVTVTDPSYEPVEMGYHAVRKD